MDLDSEYSEKPSHLQDLKRSSMGLDGVLENLEDFMNSHDEQSSAKEDIIEDEILASGDEEKGGSLLTSNTNSDHDTSVNSNLVHDCSDINTEPKKDGIPNELTLNFSTLELDSGETQETNNLKLDELNEDLNADSLMNIKSTATVHHTAEETEDIKEKNGDELVLSFKNEQKDENDLESEKDVETYLKNSEVETDDLAKIETQQSSPGNFDKLIGDDIHTNNVDTIAEEETKEMDFVVAEAATLKSTVDCEKKSAPVGINSDHDKTIKSEEGNDVKSIKTSIEELNPSVAGETVNENEDFTNAETKKGLEKDLKKTSAAHTGKECEKQCESNEQGHFTEVTYGTEIAANNNHGSKISVDEEKEKTPLEDGKNVAQAQKGDTPEAEAANSGSTVMHTSCECAKSVSSDAEKTADAENAVQNKEETSKEQKVEEPEVHKDETAVHEEVTAVHKDERAMHEEEPAVHEKNTVQNKEETSKEQKVEEPEVHKDETAVHEDEPEIYEEERATDKSLADVLENPSQGSFEEFQDSNNCMHELGCDHVHPISSMVSENGGLEKPPVKGDALEDFDDLDDDIDALLADLDKMDEDSELLAKELLEEILPETETDPAVVKKYHFKIFTSLASMDRNMVSRTNKTISLLLAQEGVSEELLELCDVGTDSSAKKQWYRKACDPVTRESLPLPGVFRESNDEDLFVGNYTMIEDFVEDCSMEEKMWPELFIKKGAGKGNKEENENSIIWRLLGKTA